MLPCNVLKRFHLQTDCMLASSSSVIYDTVDMNYIMQYRRDATQSTACHVMMWYLAVLSGMVNCSIIYCFNMKLI